MSLTAEQSETESGISPRQLVIEGLLNVGPALCAYFGLRLAGFSELHALMAATAVSATQALVKMAWKRALDPVSLLVVPIFGVSLIMAWLTRDPRLSQVTNEVPGMLLATYFLVSALIGKPLTELLVTKLWPGGVEKLAEEQGWTDEDQRSYHRLHVYVSFWCGIFSLLFCALMVVIIYTFSVDIVQAVNPVVSMLTTGGLIVGVVVAIRMYLRRKERALSGR
ncbi:VC0807 family protein [Mycobacteroides salmoniphilum]|uniref:VC0807 family protein n=1 Tax=Mycobacteroides salmoniphilum TaxID=404941 RepID=UPI0009935616|nr:VC0807 family protein [Mycobacteroides salmoniphilum]